MIYRNMFAAIALSAGLSGTSATAENATAPTSSFMNAAAPASVAPQQASVLEDLGQVSPLAWAALAGSLFTLAFSCVANARTAREIKKTTEMIANTKNSISNVSSHLSI